MVTLVGTQSKFSNAVRELVELDYDAVEAYDAAINRLENTSYKSKLREFRADHERHIKELSALLLQHNEKIPEGPSAVKQWLAKGKVVLANLVGDKTILTAMKSNEDDTNAAYEKMNQHKEMWLEAREVLQRGLADEQRHKEWLEDTINVTSLV